MEQQLLNLSEPQIAQFALALAGKPVSIADKIQNAKLLNYICQSRNLNCHQLWVKLWQEDIGGKIPNNVDEFYLHYLTSLSNLTQNDRLLEASKGGYDKLLIWSLQRGADVHYQDDLPVVLASMNGHLNIVEILDSYDANLLTQNQKALRLAAKANHRQVVDYLIRNGGDINILSSQQRKQYLP